MRPIDIGCLPQSQVFFYTPSDQTKRTFFYPLCTGHYYCDSTYLVQRNNYDSFLLIYIKKGAGYLTVQEKTYWFSAGDLLTVDCYQAHTYATTADSELWWVHFDGSTSREYVQALLSTCGPVCTLKNGLSAEKELLGIIAGLSSKEPASDALCSLSIIRILTEAMSNRENPVLKDTSTSVIEDTISYISSHIREELPLQQLADRVGLSPYYFTRLFKKGTGYTPHNYIIHSRINIAKFYLKSSDYSVKEICFRSGFPTESSFCTSFKKICGLTPGEYKAGKEHT